MERHERAVAATVAPYPEVARVALDYAKGLVPANPRPVADDRGREVRLGPDLSSLPNCPETKH